MTSYCITGYPQSLQSSSSSSSRKLLKQQQSLKLSLSLTPPLRHCCLNEVSHNNDSNQPHFGRANHIPLAYKFAQFNTTSGVYNYSNDEYHQHLRDDDWSKEETDYLVELCQTYDLRFVIIHDRYDWRGKGRSIEVRS